MPLKDTIHGPVRRQAEPARSAFPADPANTPGVSGQGILARLRTALHRLRAHLSERQQRRADRAALVALLEVEDHLLTDIGLCRHDVLVRIRELDQGQPSALRSRITTSTREISMPSGMRGRAAISSSSAGASVSVLLSSQ